MNSPSFISLRKSTKPFLLIELDSDGDCEVRSNVELSKWPQSLFEISLQTCGWINEDELPESYPYDFGFAISELKDGVRMFPKLEVSTNNDSLDSAISSESS